MPPIPTLNELILLAVMVVVVALPEVMRFFSRKTPDSRPTPKED